MVPRKCIKILIKKKYQLQELIIGFKNLIQRNDMVHIYLVTGM